MSIRIIVDTTEGTEAEIARVKEIIPNGQFFINEFLRDGIEVIFLGDYEKKVAEDNGCTVSVGTHKKVITGELSRESAEKIAMYFTGDLTRHSIFYGPTRTGMTRDINKRNQFLIDVGNVVLLIDPKNHIAYIEYGPSNDIESLKECLRSINANGEYTPAIRLIEGKVMSNEERALVAEFGGKFDDYCYFNADASGCDQVMNSDGSGAAIIAQEGVWSYLEIAAILAKKVDKGDFNALLVDKICRALLSEVSFDKNSIDDCFRIADVSLLWEIVSRHGDFGNLECFKKTSGVLCNMLYMACETTQRVSNFVEVLAELIESAGWDMYIKRDIIMSNINTQEYVEIPAEEYTKKEER